MDKRKFTRYKFSKPVRYRKVHLVKDKTLDSMLINALSKDLSHGGICFTTQNPPKISDLIIMFMGPKSTTEVLGKVVRIDDLGNDQFKVAIAFVENSQKAMQEIAYLTKHAQHHRATDYFIKIILALFILFILYAINFVHLQYQKLYVPGDRMITLTPTSIDMTYEDIYFKTADGEVLNGWLIPAEGAKATMIYSHGNEGNMTDRLGRLNFFHSLKINIFIYDYRGYGKSTGRPSEQGLYQDVQGAYDYLMTRKETNKTKIIALGVSLGGAVATDLSMHRKVNVLILESTFVSLLTQAKDLYPYFPVDLFVHDEFNTIGKIKNITIPKLIVHGIDDEAILFKHARFLFDDAPPPKEFLPFHGGHSDDVFTMSDAYKNVVGQFLLKYKIIESLPASH